MLTTIIIAFAVGLIMLCIGYFYGRYSALANLIAEIAQAPNADGAMGALLDILESFAGEDRD